MFERTDFITCRNKCNGTALKPSNKNIRMKKFLLILALVPFVSVAQEVEKNKRKVYISANNGLWFNTNYDLSNSQWKKMVPDWTYFDSIDVTTGTAMNRSFGANQSNVVSIDFVHPKLSGEHFEVSTSILLGHGQQVSAYESRSRETRTPLDTLVSQQTGQSYEVNQLEYVSENRNYNAKFILIGIGEHFATNPKRRFQFRTGIEAFASLSYQSEVSVSFSKEYSYEGFQNYYNPSAPLPENKFVSQQSTANMLTGMVVRVPLDINWCLSQKENFFNRVRIGMEFNPGLGMIFRDGTVRSNFTAQFASNLKIRF